MFPGASLDIREELTERDFGQWDGLAWKEIERQWPADAAYALENWLEFTPPGGEPWPEFADRVQRFWRATPRTENLIVVAHHGVNALLAEFAGLGPAISFKQDYAEIISIPLSD
jgi:alpha-ribazole phosphatase